MGNGRIDEEEHCRDLAQSALEPASSDSCQELGGRAIAQSLRTVSCRACGTSCRCTTRSRWPPTIDDHNPMVYDPNGIERVADEGGGVHRVDAVQLGEGELPRQRPNRLSATILIGDGSREQRPHRLLGLDLLTRAHVEILPAAPAHCQVAGLERALSHLAGIRLILTRGDTWPRPLFGSGASFVVPSRSHERAARTESRRPTSCLRYRVSGRPRRCHDCVPTGAEYLRRCDPAGPVPSSCSRTDRGAPGPRPSHADAPARRPGARPRCR